MTRPSRNADRLLIQAARELLPMSTCSGLNIRQISRHAGVNLGMFHYHFKTKEEFLRVLLQEIYDELSAKLIMETNPKTPPLHNLRQALLAFGAFALENRKLLLPLLKDLLGGEPLVLEFANKNFPRHIQLFTELIAACQAKHQLRQAPPVQLLISLLSGVAFPILLGAGLEVRQPKIIFSIHETLLTKEAIALRVEMTLKGMAYS